MRTKAFTLIEIVIVILVAAILAVVAVSKIIDLSTESLKNNEKYVAGVIRTGITNEYARSIVTGSPSYPDTLDNASEGPASASNPLFSNVLASSMTSEWEKLASDTYKGPAGNEYVYDKENGTFMLASSGGGGGEESGGAITWAYPGTQISDAATVIANAATQTANIVPTVSSLAATAADLVTITGIPSTAG